MEANTQTILIVFVAFTALSVLLQACVLFGIYIALKKTTKTVLEVTEDLKDTVIPMVLTTREMLDRVKPQVFTITAGLAEFTETVRSETAGVTFSVVDVMQRVDRQSQRLDSMLTSTLNAIERVADILETAVAMPVRQVNGIFAAVKAVVDTYRSEGSPRRSSSNGPSSNSASKSAPAPEKTIIR